MRQLRLLRTPLFWITVFVTGASGFVTALGQEKPVEETERQLRTGDSLLKLEPGKAMERDLIGGAVHDYNIFLTAGQFINVVVDQRGIDVIVKLFRPDSKLVVEIDSPNGTEGPEPVLAIADLSGNYRLEVLSPEASVAAGRYEIRIQELRAGTEKDKARIAALARWEEAKLLLAEAVKLYNEGKYDKATLLNETALEILEVAMGPDHLDIAMAMQNLATLYWTRHDYDRAESLFRRSMEMRVKVLGHEDSEVATTVFSLAILFRDKGDYVQAESLFRRAQVAYEKTLGPEHQNVALPIHQLALMYWQKGEYAQAETLLLSALAIQEKALSSDHSYFSATLGDLATIYRDMGDFPRAESLQKRAVELVEKAIKADHPFLAAAYHNLAVIYQKQGDYSRAEPLFQRALQIYEKSLTPSHPDIATGIHSLALLYEEKGDYERAELLNKRALSIFEKALGPEHISVGNTLNSLANLAVERKNYAQAETFYRRAVAIYEKALGNENPSLATMINNMGIANELKGDYASAEPLYMRALAIRQKALVPSHPDIAASYNSLAMLYLKKRDYDLAETMFKSSLAISEKALGPKHPLLARYLSNFAALYIAKGETEKAVALQTRSGDIREQNISLVFTTGSENQKRLYLESLSDETDMTISLHIRSAPNSQDAVQLSFATILSRKGRLLDVMSDQTGALRRRLNPEDQALLNQLTSTNARLAYLTLQGPGTTRFKSYQDDVAKIEEERQRLEAGVSVRSAEFREQLQPVTIKSVQDALPAGAALVEVALYRPLDLKAKSWAERFGPPRYVAYVLRRDRMPTWVDLGDSTLIDGSVSGLRNAMNDSRQTNVATLKHIARELDEKLMRRIRRLLGDTRRVFLSPDGALNLLPFGALIDERGHYLVEDYSFSYLTSGRDLLRVERTTTVTGQVPVVLADPAFDLTVANTAIANDGGPDRRSGDLRETRLQPLAGTKKEAQQIKLLMPESRVLIGAEATETAMKQVSHPRILHMATHGFFLENSPHTSNVENPLLRSGLFLAGANKRQSGPGEDGVLTALEVSGLDLWGTKLVVLSACETGLGDVKNGEGVYGLRRALVLAGSETQVMSLWKVSDLGTRDLMVAYYRRLQKGEGRTEALRQVQLAMLRGKLTSTPDNNSDKQKSKRDTTDMQSEGSTRDYSHPYYWAAFIPSGDWRNLAGQE